MEKLSTASYIRVIRGLYRYFLLKHSLIYIYKKEMERKCQCKTKYTVIKNIYTQINTECIMCNYCLKQLNNDDRAEIKPNKNSIEYYFKKLVI